MSLENVTWECPEDTVHGIVAGRPERERGDLPSAAAKKIYESFSNTVLAAAIPRDESHDDRSSDRTLISEDMYMQRRHSRRHLTDLRASEGASVDIPIRIDKKAPSDDINLRAPEDKIRLPLKPGMSSGLEQQLLPPPQVRAVSRTWTTIQARNEFRA